MAPNLVQFALRLKMVQQCGSALLFGLLIFLCTFGSSFGSGAAGRFLSVVPYIIFLLLGLALIGGLPSALRTVRISGRIAAERQRGTYDLLHLTGLGAYGLHWWIARSVGGVGKKLYEPVNRPIWLTRLLLILLAVIVGLGTLNLFFREPGFTLQIIIYVASTIFGFVSYFRENTAAAGLLGMLIPAYLQKQFEARFWSFTAFALFQVATIGLLILTGVIIDGLLFRNSFSSGTAVPVYIYDPLRENIIFVVRLTLFISIREFLIYWLYSKLRQQLNGSDEELDLLTRIAL